MTAVWRSMVTRFVSRAKVSGASAVKSGSSYASQSDLALTFGIAQDPMITSVQVEWPSGTKQKFANVQPNQAIVIDEAKGILPAAK